MSPAAAALRVPARQAQRAQRLKRQHRKHGRNRQRRHWWNRRFRRDRRNRWDGRVRWERRQHPGHRSRRGHGPSQRRSRNKSRHGYSHCTVENRGGENRLRGRAAGRILNVPGSALFFLGDSCFVLGAATTLQHADPPLRRGGAPAKAKACDDVSYKVRRVRFADRKA